MSEGKYAVIADVSETLRVLLTAALTDVQIAATVELHDLLFDAPPSGPKLTIFLFEIAEDPSARNRPRMRETATPNLKIRKPPVALVLRYLLTAWGTDLLTAQLILGRVIQVLYDKAIISGPDFAERYKVLAGTDTALNVTMSPLSLEERTRIWHAVQKPYRLSLCYEVRVVNLESEAVTLAKPVTQRTLDMNE